MNRRKFFLGIAGVGVAGVAIPAKKHPYPFDEEMEWIDGKYQVTKIIPWNDQIVELSPDVQNTMCVKQSWNNRTKFSWHKVNISEAYGKWIRSKTTNG